MHLNPFTSNVKYSRVNFFRGTCETIANIMSVSFCSSGKLDHPLLHLLGFPQGEKDLEKCITAVRREKDVNFFITFLVSLNKSANVVSISKASLHYKDNIISLNNSLFHISHTVMCGWMECKGALYFYKRTENPGSPKFKGV